ncbi:MAG: phenylalanine--tRNA ligase subunit beta [Candidatus Rokuibacteriota bacterium]|nr:MAG: phenylalanine--tRNA ligase subunit beta [Candidatus Rokubacteria bacterium]
MKISYRWLKEFVETELTPREIADRLVNAGIEVAAITPVVEGLSGVVVAEIEAIERDLGATPAGHHNRLCRVRLPDRTFSVICGAPNATPGLRTAFAPPGATLPASGAVKAVRIRGVSSEGILCSEQELGLSEDHGGILALPADAPLGADLSTYLGLDDWILEIEITPNRPDALSVVGVAREISALTGAPFRSPRVAVKEGEHEASSLAAVEIEAPDLCPRFCARVITGLTVRPSPPWLAQRLRAVGLRPINNLVDVTNYVMWELGQPLHAFDLDAVAQHRIVVRRARPGERLITLDGQERVLAPTMAMVCDPERALGIGGVMGGAEAEVTDRTTAVLLEAAYWDPGSIRRTSRALGLATDAAYRFERGGDIEGLGEVLHRAAHLMADLGGGTVARGMLDVYPSPRPRPRITLRLSRVERVIGACPPRDDAVRILRALGFTVEDSAADLQVTVPSFRRDIFQEDDLVEEIVRIWGYDKIPLARDRGGEFVPVTRPAGLRLARAVSGQLNAAGLFECITYAFVDPDRLKPMGWENPGELIALQNPLSQDRSVLRPSLLPGLLGVLATNASRQSSDARIFEVGRVFMPHREEDGDHPAHEEFWVGLALTGLRQPRAWHAPRERVDVYDAKGMAELVLAAAGVAEWEAAGWPEGAMPRYLERGRGGRLAAAGRDVGTFGELALPVREAFDLGAPVFVAELSLSTLLALPPWTPRYQALPRYPAVQRDLALVVPEDVTAGEIESAIRALRLPLLTRLALFDVYTGDQIGPGRRSLAWSLTFQAPDRTLRDSEVNDLHARIVTEISKRFKAEVRGV